jgi:hypothetical protein
VKADVDEAAGAGVGACSFACVNRLELLVEVVGSLENGLEACGAGDDCAAASFDGCAGVAWDLKPENAGAVLLKALPALLVSGWKVCANMPDPVDFGCAVNMPAWDLSTPAVFAGCGVLKPLNRLGLLASGAFEDAASTGLSAVLASLFCAASKRLNPGVLAVVVGGGLANEANKFGFGVSEGALAAGSGALTLLNRDGFGVPAASVGSLIALNGLLAAAGACS